MFSFTPPDHLPTLKVLEEIKEQNKLNVDEYKIKKPLTPIQSFYAGKSIFLTGPLGFLGTALVEKLLRDCSDIKKLYVLIRPNKKYSVEERIKKYFADICFNRLRKINPNFEDKVAVIKGDLGLEDLGLSPEDRQLLVDNVNIMIHNGASVRFDESFSATLKVNVLGTKAMLDLALACKKIIAFAYISTAYSHHYQRDIEEKFYEPAVGLNAVYDIIGADEMTKDGLSPEATRMLLGNWINAYTFSKSVSEDLVRQYGEKANFLCTVYRPSMVFSACKEPMIGWYKNKNGPVATLLGLMLGIIHVGLDNLTPFDVIPPDYTINALIACIYDATKQWEIEKRPRMFNFGSSAANKLTVRRMGTETEKIITTVGLEHAVWHFSAIPTESKLVLFILHFFLHCIPGAFADLALLCMGKKPKALTICLAVTRNMNWISYFTTFGWRIHIVETRKVFENISEADRKLFDFDIWTLDWEEYMSRTILGAKIYLLNESIDNLEKGRRRSIFLKNLHITIRTVFYLFVAYYVMRWFSILVL